MPRPRTRSGNRDPARRTLRWRCSPLPTTPADLRSRVRVALAGWSIVGRAAEDVVLIVSELVTNVVEHAHTPMQLTLGRVGDRVRVRVRDYSGDPPVLRSTEDDPSRGWGLRMIDKAASWGWVPHPDGKTVWASIELGPRRPHTVRP